MTIRIYIDEDSMDRALVRALRARGVDVRTANDEGMIDREDQEHLDYATQQGRVLYTFNLRDFFQLHTLYLQQGKSHAGLILARQQHYSVGEQMRRLLRLIAAKSGEEMRKIQHPTLADLAEAVLYQEMRLGILQEALNKLAKKSGQPAPRVMTPEEFADLLDQRTENDAGA